MVAPGYRECGLELLIFLDLDGSVFASLWFFDSFSRFRDLASKELIRFGLDFSSSILLDMIRDAPAAFPPPLVEGAAAEPPLPPAAGGGSPVC